MTPHFSPSRLAAVVVSAALFAASCSTSATFDATEATPEPATADPEPDGAEEPAPAPDPDPSPDDDPPDPAPGDGSIVDGNWSYEDADCRFDEPAEVDTRCGRLTVPARWSEPQGDTVQLEVAVFSDPTASTGPDPIVYLEGGPGGHALETIPFGFTTLFEPFLASHDVVVFDQRGAGFSEPGLTCPESVEADLVNAGVAESAEVETDRSIDAIVECRDRLVDEGADLTAFNSVESSHDVEALRQALGYDSWNVLGISYGTRLAQTLMREHPEGIRAVVIDSVVPLEGDLDALIPSSAKRAYEVLWAGCAADPQCNEAYPGIEDRFFALVAAADEEPFAFEASDPLTGETAEFLVTGDDLLGVGFQALYSQSLFAAIPETVARLEVGDTSGLETYAGLQLLNDGFLSLGMFLSVECHEENSFTELADYEAGLSGDPRYDRVADGALNAGEVFSEICERWGAGAAAPVEDEPLVSDIPTLVMAGEYDPITPPAGGLAVANNLVNGIFYEYPHLGHAAVTDACPQQMALAFFADPATVDDSCIADITPPAFVIGDVGEITLVDFSFDEGFISASGVTPEGWVGQGSGAFARNRSVLDQVFIVQQVVDQVGHDFVVASLADSLGATEAPVVYDERAVDGRTFTFYEVAFDGGLADIALGDDAGFTHLVLLGSNDETERAVLRTEVLEPVVAAIGP